MNYILTIGRKVRAKADRFSHLRQLRPINSKLLISGDVVGHLSVVVFLVSDHIEVTCAGEAEDDVLGFAGLFALEGLIDGRSA